MMKLSTLDQAVKLRDELMTLKAMLGRLEAREALALIIGEEPHGGQIGLTASFANEIRERVIAGLKNEITDCAARLREMGVILPGDPPPDPNRPLPVSQARAG